MRTKTLCFMVLLAFAVSCPLFAQGGRIQEKLNVGATPLAQGDLKISEVLTTRDGTQLVPGYYRVAVAVNSLGEAQFVISEFVVTSNTRQDVGLAKNALNVKKVPPESVAVPAIVGKNLLVKKIASNLEGDFTLKAMTPTETMLSFNSKQFSASAILGRDINAKLVDLTPSFLSLDQPTECGTDCIEGYVKVTIRNEGNAEAKGKWNVILSDPPFFVGTIADLPAGGDRVVTSSSKLQLPCCGTVNIESEVHPDFYNKDGIDSNDSNNIHRFSLKLK